MKCKCPVCREKFVPYNSRHTYCNTRCGNRAKKIKKRYGLHPEDVVRMYKEQRGRCAICNIKGDVFELGFNKRTTLVIDHNHTTGAVRGLLCDECNLGIGKLKDNWRLLDKASVYLQDSNKKEKHDKTINSKRKTTPTKTK